MKTITDGSAVFTVRDKRMQAMIDFFYPIGSVYMSADKSKTKADFPFMAYGTWEEVPANLCLQIGTASEAGTQRSAGLPNIRGEIWQDYEHGILGGIHGSEKCYEGAFTFGKHSVQNSCTWANYGDSKSIGFDASLSNPIYGASDTVQPPAYMVRAWVRTA